jgi:Mlc titration factor MtfA (ptsG expression regulator)
MFGLGKRSRRQKLRETPLPTAWREILTHRVPYYARLGPEDQRELEGHTHVLLTEKNFEGCGGLALTDEMQVVIAAYAALLLLHRDTDYYPRLVSILVYPRTFLAPVRDELPGGVVATGRSARIGESWTHGTLILAWDAIVRDLAGTGENVILHELAHQLDGEDGVMNGAPVFQRDMSPAAWAQVLRREYDQLLADVDGEEEVLRAYGAKNPAEFFAVATETFFERPHALRRVHRALYDQLKSYYRQDPASLPGFPEPRRPETPPFETQDGA